MGSNIIRIEHPAWQFNENPEGGWPNHVEFRWTNNINKHLDPVSTIRDDWFYVYLPVVVMHEMGHPAGLADLYGDQFMGRYSDYLMGERLRTNIPTTIPTEDVYYLREAYRNILGGSSPH